MGLIRQPFKRGLGRENWKLDLSESLVVKKQAAGPSDRHKEGKLAGSLWQLARDPSLIGPPEENTA